MFACSATVTISLGRHRIGKEYVTKFARHQSTRHWLVLISWLLLASLPFVPRIPFVRPWGLYCGLFYHTRRPLPANSRCVSMGFYIADLRITKINLSGPFSIAIRLLLERRGFSPCKLWICYDSDGAVASYMIMGVGLVLCCGDNPALKEGKY